jgi:SAM-dependent methyltransferase
MTQRGESVSFDRAADYYDRTRGLSAQTAAAQTAVLIEALQDVDGRVLEIGVGTGRVALPLAEAGLQIVGIDLSAAMLARLRAKGGASVPVARADATRLPFADGSVAAVLVAHVFHLVADWRAVLAEIERVVRPGGGLLATRGGGGAGPLAELQSRAREAAGWSMPEGRLDDLAELDAELSGRGGQATRLPTVLTDRAFSAAEYLQSLADNIYSWTWDFTDEQRANAGAAARAWVTATYGDPASVTIESAPIDWNHYRLPT